MEKRLGIPWKRVNGILIRHVQRLMERRSTLLKDRASFSVPCGMSGLARMYALLTEKMEDPLWCESVTEDRMTASTELLILEKQLFRNWRT